MNAHTKAVISQVQQQWEDQGLSKTQWKVVLGSKLDAEALEQISSAVSIGTKYLSDPKVQALAEVEYPWMFTQFDQTRSDTTGREYQVKTMKWIDKIREFGPSKPKDLVHLANVVELAENRDTIEHMAW